MARFVLFEATPWRVVDGVAESVRLAGGGSKPYSGLRGFTDWRSGLADFPTFAAMAGFSDGGWTGQSIPQTSQVRVFPSDEALRTILLSKYQWKGARVELRSGDDELAPGTYVLEIVGTVDNVAVSEGSIVFTIADFAAKLSVPVVTARFAGTGGIEGPVEAAGRAKRRTWGFVRNVEGLLLDKPNNIFEFGDPAFPLYAFGAVRDKGRDASPAGSVLAWQGSIAATLTALQASVPGQGSCVVAPSIACVKWWTVPAGPLTADIEGEVGVGYVNKVADIATRLCLAAPGDELLGAVNGGFDADVAGWTVDAGAFTWQAGGKARLASNGAANAQVRRLVPAVTTGRTYRITVKVDANNGQLVIGAGDNSAVGGAVSLNAFTTGTFTLLWTAGAIPNGGAVFLIANLATPTIGDFDFAAIEELIQVGDTAAINAARPAVSGIHIGDDSETIAQALDRLFIPVNVIWGLNPNGSIRLSEIQLAAPAEVVAAIEVDRLETYRPVWQARLGYKRNHRQHSDGEISAALFLGNVTGPPESTSFQYDYLNAADFGGTRDLTFKLLWGDGSTLTSGVTWQYRVLNGTVNGFTSASGWQAASGAGVGTVSIASVGTDTASIEVKATYSGEPKSAIVPLTKVYSPAPTGGGGGGGGTPLPLSKNSGFASINSTTFTDLTGWLPGTMPAGKTTAQLAATLSFMPTVAGGDGSWTVELKWQRDVAGVATDIGGGAAVVTGNSSKSTDADGGPIRNPASITNNKSDTGLTALGSYQWRLMGRLQSGTRTHNTGGTCGVTAP